MTNARLTLIVLVTRSVVRIHVKSSVFNRLKVSVIYLVGRAKAHTSSQAIPSTYFWWIKFFLIL